MAEYMRTDAVFANFADGDNGGWLVEFEFLRQEHAPRIRSLTMSILQRGIQEPILLGDDGRVWDGHHRLYVARHMGLEYVPVKHAREDRRG